MFWVMSALQQNLRQALVTTPVACSMGGILLLSWACIAGSSQSTTRCLCGACEPATCTTQEQEEQEDGQAEGGSDGGEEKSEEAEEKSEGEEGEVFHNATE